MLSPGAYSNSEISYFSFTEINFIYLFLNKPLIKIIKFIIFILNLLFINNIGLLIY